MASRKKEFIRVEGARQNNLKNLSLDLPLGELIVVTGVSGSGKSSFAFDTVYAEGQRRYVETFSPYARQFLDRMDRPKVDRIQGIPPAIAIDQINPVRTSRSTVGTMTELNDHLKLLFALAAHLYCNGCGNEVRKDSAQSVVATLLTNAGDAEPLNLITFPVAVPENFSAAEVEDFLAKQGYTRLLRPDETHFEVIQDRVRLSARNRDRIVEAVEAALKFGNGLVGVHQLDQDRQVIHSDRYSTVLHCAACDRHFHEPVPSHFSFNSPLGACPDCRGFGRTMGIDYSLVVPDEQKTLAQGAVKPWQSESYRECQADLLRFAKRCGISTTTPWNKLKRTEQRWVLEGEGGGWDDDKWYGVKLYFEWLESRSYKMHIRVLLSRYRSYEPCTTCLGARLKPEALLWRLGSRADATQALGDVEPFVPAGMGQRVVAGLPGLTMHDIMMLPIAHCTDFLQQLELPPPLDEATELLLGEIRARLRFLVEVGLGYLTLDRQSRTLSGGEVQRINLTTALGTSLVNTLFVLDEPSIGLHSRDMGRVIGVLERLRDAGNSLLVVEHDEQVMRHADRILDLGPGPGERGGEIVFFGTPTQLLKKPDTPTGHYLAYGTPSTVSSRQRPGNLKRPAFLQVIGAAEHNLQGIDVHIPLNRLVCITGVSGSGKSTLVETIVYRALRKHFGRPVDPPGRHVSLKGHDHLHDVVLVDQTPIGRTTRSNPASYVGALDAIRKQFADQPLAKERNYTAGTFSFNSGNGRCPACGGNGFEHIEMQFLSDVYLRCADCDGRRYRAEVLEVSLTGDDAYQEAKSIADVLDLTAQQAIEFFSTTRAVTTALEPLLAVGLGYLKLGQPVPTLSGGEAQRLKLAGHLAKKAKGSNGKQGVGQCLFLFDEPTTGLHFADVQILLGAFDELIAKGHSLVVIEHHLDVVRASDWVIDLGPEGGNEGGRIVDLGTPAELSERALGHTGIALSGASPPSPNKRNASSAARTKASHPGMRQEVTIRNAREHNLKGINLRIPRNQLTVVTGISGSGKSTIAFDILFAEGQRRYLESLNAYARQFVQPAARPDVDAIFGIPPAVAIEQRTSRGGRKSTVATLTEIYHFLRLLFVKLGTQYCPKCDLPIEPQHRGVIVANVLRDYRGKTVTVLAPLVVARKGYYTDLAKWASNKGYDALLVDGTDLPTGTWPRLDRFKEHDIDLPVGNLKVTAQAENRLRDLIDTALQLGNGLVRISTAQGDEQGDRQPTLFSTKRACANCNQSFPELDPRLFSFNSRHGWCATCFGTGRKLSDFDQDQTGEEQWWLHDHDSAEQICQACRGNRLKPEALSVRFHDRSIAELTSLSVDDAEQHFAAVALNAREGAIASDIFSELRSRLRFLNQVGLDYLSLDRSAPTLSGGEAQRIRLAAQLGSNLRGVCYILDEPTIGLHTRDNRRLLDTLSELRAQGNTVVVVEHDEETIRRAEHIIDVGPQAGINGGEIMVTGPLAKVLRCRRSLTGRYLANPLRHPLDGRELPSPDVDLGAITLRGVRRHNLRGVQVKLPLGQLICVTGVSGSGKSTLVRDVLKNNLDNVIAARARRDRPDNPPAYACTTFTGSDVVQRVLEVDQTPIGKTPRSCPATYTGIWNTIRQLLADTTEARIRGFEAKRFSFNVHGGRCDGCDGQGMRRIEMSFLPDVRVSCEVCNGARFNNETLAVRYRGKTVTDILHMSIDEALPFFTSHPRVHRTLGLMCDVGLGYLQLGQQSPTLSGGEAQRLKLVTELAKDSRHGQAHHTLYLLDEPTIGLHMADVEKLIRVLHRLVDAGNTVVVIEHNLDIIAEADWMIDLGPEGGTGGGRLMAQGTPNKLVSRKNLSHTTSILKSFLAERSV